MPPSLPTLLLVLLVVLLILLLPSPVITTCPPTPRPTTCLPSLKTQPSLYKACKTTPCFLFISEPPFTILPKSPNPLPNLPFPCHDPFPYEGITFLIHAQTPPALCIYAGHDCSFEDLIHFTRAHKQYQFGITGLLIHTPDRLCFHDPASPIMEDAMVIIGSSVTGQRVDQLIRPFSTITWLIFGIMLLLIFSTSFCIAFVSRGKPSVVTSIFVATGNSAVVLQRSIRTQPTMLTKYSLATTLLKISVAVLVTMMALFYEAGVVNFLFQQNTAELGKHVRSLSIPELSRYSVLKESALEKVWNKTVNPYGDLYDALNEHPPWKRCETPEECVQWVADPYNEVMFDVTFGVSARFLIQQLSSCDKLTIFETKDILYHFTGGWLYNEAIPSDYRQMVDRILIGLRINRTLGRIYDKSLTKGTCAQEVSPQLGPMIVALPLGLIVLPPLLGSVLILLCMKSGNKEEIEESGTMTQNNDAKSVSAISNIVSNHADGESGVSMISSINENGGHGVTRASTQELEELPEP